MASQWIDFVSGWCSGTATVLCLQPLDTILTRRQAGAFLVNGSLWTSGPSKFWRGSAPMIGALPFQSAMLMAGYGLGKSSDSLWGVFLGGCTGGVLQSLVMSPIELVKVQRQIYLGRGPVALEVANWHRGLGATLLRDGVPHGIWFVSYELCKDFLSEHVGESHQEFTVPFLSGAFAATAAWGLGYPADLIKTRIQAKAIEKQSVGIIETALELVEESPRGLYRGFSLKLARSIPASMIGFTTYEYVRKKLEQRALDY